MKILLKLLQYILKFLASILSKLGAQYTYTKLYKRLMKYKFIFIIYKPLMFIFSNIIYFIKLSSVIIAIFSLFNISLFYYNFDVINEVNDLIMSIINWFKALLSKWFSNDEEEISEPVDFFTTKKRKEFKVIEKTIQQASNNSYWVLPLMIIGYGALYYYNPHINLELFINPVVSKIEDQIPENLPITFITGTFIYKFITVSISYVTGYNFIEHTEDEPKSNEDDTKPIENYDLTSTARNDFINKDKSRYSPIDSLSLREQAEFEAYFPKIEDDMQTPKASVSKLPETTSSENTPLMKENPFNKIKIIPYSKESSEIKLEE